MNRSLVVRADATPEIGTGHLMRGVALAQAWRGCGGRSAFIGVCGVPALRERIAAAGGSFVPLDSAHPDPRDLERTRYEINRLRDEAAAGTDGWLMLDGYHFDLAYQRAVRGCGRRLLVVDDNASPAGYHCDVLLNQNLGAERLAYRCERPTVHLLGPRYALLRDEFRPWRGRTRSIAEPATRLLVTLGGSDPSNVTARVLRALRRLARPVECRVVIGAANAHARELQREAMACEGVTLLDPVADMPLQMAWADLAVAAGGITCWELAFMGVPMVILRFAENQQPVASGLAAAGAAVDLGWHQGVTEASVAEAIEGLLAQRTAREAMSRAGRALVDGAGADRVVDTLTGRA